MYLRVIGIEVLQSEVFEAGWYVVLAQYRAEH